MTWQNSSLNQDSDLFCRFCFDVSILLIVYRRINLYIRLKITMIIHTIVIQRIFVRNNL